MSASASAPACTPPATAATAFTSSTLSTTGATLGWTSGNGTNRAVFLKNGAFTAATPAANTTYAANASFTGNGTAFDGGKTVYNNSGNSVSVTDLTPNTRYYAKVFEYTGTAGAECYNTTALSGNFTTLSNPVTATAASPISANSFTANWTAPTGNGSATLTYTLEVATDNAFSNLVQTNSGISSVNTNFSVTSLSPATTYYYRVTAVNSGGASAPSNVITVTTRPAMPPAFTTTNNCGSVTLNAYTGPDASTYYWQTDPINPNTNFPATQPYVVTASGQYSVQAYANGLWSSANSANIVVPNNPVITTQPANTSVGAGSNATFTVVATNAGSYQWQENSGAGFVNLPNNARWSGVNTPTLTVTGVTQFMDGYQYRVVVKASAPCTADVYSAYPYARLTVTPVSNATDYFRSRTTGLYGNAGTWESSADSLTWINATAFPTSSAKSVTIRTGDVVTVSSTGRNASHLYVYGTLTLDGQDFNIGDASGYDAVVFNSGIINYGANALTLASGATLLVKTGGKISGATNMMNTAARGNSYFYEDAAVVEYTSTNSFTASGQTFFPTNTSLTTSPILVLSKTISGNLGGSTSATIINGILKIPAGVNITWGNSANRILRNGLIIDGSVSFATGTMTISGPNAILEGSGAITFSSTGKLEIDPAAVVQLNTNVEVNSGSLTVNGTLNTNGHVLSGSAQFATAAGSTLIITDAAGIAASGTSGNIQTGGTRTFNAAGNYVYRSTAAQTTGDGLPNNLSGTLEMDNLAGVTLSASRTVTGTLKLTSGNLTTTANELLTLGSAATLTGGSAASYINGPLKRNTAAATAFVFPVGKGATYAPVTLTPQTATASDYTAEYFTTPTPNRSNKDAALKYVAANEHFEISRGAGGADARITLSYTSAAQVTDPTTLVVAHYNGTQWVSEGQSARSGNNNAGTVTSANIVSSFSPFALGSTSASQPLPVQLLSFNLHKKESAALLEWELATTDGDEQVMVARSADGVDFVTVSSHKVSKAERLHQTFTDVMPMAGPNFYRLRIVSANGAVQFSKVLSVRFDGSVNGWSLYPNPAKDVLHLEWPDATAPVQVRMYSATGQLVYAENVSGRSTADVSVSNLADGTYWVVMEQAGHVERHQVRVKR